MSIDRRLLEPEQRRILAYLDRFGAIPQARAELEGWTRQGVVSAPLQGLVDLRIVAPRVITSYPLRCSWELRAGAKERERAAALEKMCREYKIKEYAGTLPKALTPAARWR